MPWRQDPADPGWWVNDETGESQNYDPRMPKPGTPGGPADTGAMGSTSYTGFDAGGAQQGSADFAAHEASKATAQDQLDPNSPNYIGPGYTLSQSADGSWGLRLVDQQAHDNYMLNLRMSPASNPTPANPNTKTADEIWAEMHGATSAVQSRAPTAATGYTRDSGTRPRAVGEAPVSAGMNPERPTDAAFERVAGQPVTGPDANPYTAPGAEAPKVDRTAADKAIAGVNKIGGLLLSEAMQNSGASVAEAQLREATARAEAHALGNARGGNRRDRALNERQAISEGAFLEQEAGRQTATLRAQEEQQNRQFKVDTLQKAGDLGLNVAAYEVDLSKADLDSANNWINQEFAQLGLDKQLGMQGLELDQRKFESVLGFTQAMAAIQFDYDKLSVDDQNYADELMMRKYGIDENTRVALKGIKEQGRFRWDQLLGNIVGGAVGGVTGAIGKKFL